jgi:peptide/nickel transport system substrate-binding protein
LDTLNQSRRVYDREERRQLIYEAQRIAYEDLPLLVYNTRDVLIPLRTDRFSDPVIIPGVGVDSVQNHLNIKPASGVSRLRVLKPGRAVNNLNPLFGIEGELVTYRNFYDTLLISDPETLRPQPWMATDWNVVNDTTIEMTLRDGLTFHDGESLTAEDVKFTFEFMGENSPAFEPLAAPVASVETDGETGLRFNLQQPNSPFINLSLTQVFVLPQHIWANVSGNPTDFTNESPVGSGPFRVDFWRPQEEVGLRVFDGHFSNPNIGELSYIPTADTQTAVRFIESGDGDTFAIQSDIPPTSIDRVRNSQNTRLIQSPGHGPFTLMFNLNRQPMNDRAFRQAAARLVPRQDILQTLFRDFGTVENDTVITKPIEFWHNSNLSEHRFDPEQARQILTDAGYTYDDQDRLRYPA